MEAQPTVQVKPVDGYNNAYWLIWDKQVREADLAPAFNKLTTVMDASPSAVHVIVDLRSNPDLPLAPTIQETLAGPFRHTNMGVWLVIGSNWRAKMVGDVVSKVSSRTNILWFDTEEAALAKLAEIGRKG